MALLGKENTKIMSKLAPCLLLLFFFLCGLFLIQDTSPTTDEIPFHMVNGYTYLKTHDYRMSPANPPLIRQWMALPWLFIKPDLNLDKKSWREADSVPFGVEFFYKDNRQIANKLLYSSRFMILILGLLLGLVIYLWAKELYGDWGGVLSLVLYVSCPSFLAHSSIAHTDVGVALFCTLSAYFLWKFLESDKKRFLLIFSLVFGMACAAKYNALILGIFFLLTILAKKGFKEFGASTLLTVFVAFFVVWSSYFFEFKPLLWEGVPRIEEKLGFIPSFLHWPAQNIPIPMPSYILGIAGIIRSHQSPYLHYAFGEWTTNSHWYFYLFSFAVKMTIPFLCFLIFRAISFKYSSSKKGNENLVVLITTIAYFLMTFSDSTGVGVRYLFPIIPLLMVWAGGVVLLWKTLDIVIILLAFSALISLFRNFPDCLSYFNSFVGGSKNGYKFVRGSDVDWGQGLKELKKFMDYTKIPEVTLRYFGTADPSFYGIKNRPFSDEEIITPSNRVYAISIFNLEHIKWAKSRKPDALIKGSIFIYDTR